MQEHDLGMTVDQVALRLGVHRNTIRLYIRQKRLRAVKIGGKWRVSEEDLQTFFTKSANIPKRVA